MPIALTACTSKREAACTSEVLYFPIGLETYVPILPEDIEERALRRGRLSCADAERLLERVALGGDDRIA